MQPASARFASSCGVQGSEMLRRKSGLVLFWAGLIFASFSWGEAGGFAMDDLEFPGPAVLVAVNGDWGTYAYDDHGVEACFILAIATQVAGPAPFDDAGIYFLVSRIQGSGRRYRPEFRASYDIQPGAILAVTDMSFDMLVRGSAAWTADLDDEPVVIAAMKAGASVMVSTRTGSNIPTRYVFSLSGFNAALDSIDICAYKPLSDARWTDRPAAA